MDTAAAAFLGIIQGLTEFLPVSSSGHLVLFQHLFGLKETELLLDVTLHLGTLFAVCIYFYSDLKKMASDIFKMDLKSPQGNMFMWVLVASVPTGLIGFFLKDPLEALFSDPFKVGFMLLATGFFLIITRFIPSEYCRKLKIGLVPALTIGLAQGIAIAPGISRSGATIVCGLLLGLRREIAGSFSFILSIPAILGALFLQLGGEEIARVGVGPLAAGFITAALVGLLALRLLMKIVKVGHLYYFAPYCWLAGIITILAVRTTG
ncbi:MAG: undecaprenyl-diphosphate phosphatase [Desulfobacteraceae bacterium]|jgi:undecaprenyl-diphosphatase|nr:MAG: undecaprenyl-diphosphate phosphatase [Desulfobacteraceae bacterium]